MSGTTQGVVSDCVFFTNSIGCHDFEPTTNSYLVVFIFTKNVLDYMFGVRDCIFLTSLTVMD